VGRNAAAAKEAVDKRIQYENNQKLQQLNEAKDDQGVLKLMREQKTKSEAERIQNKYLDMLKERGVPSEIISLKFLGDKPRAEVLYQIWKRSDKNQLNELRKHAAQQDRIITEALVERVMASEEYPKDFKNEIAAMWQARQNFISR
jgi:hypothetical protein